MSKTSARTLNFTLNEKNEYTAKLRVVNDTSCDATFRILTTHPDIFEVVPNYALLSYVSEYNATQVVLKVLNQTSLQPMYAECYKFEVQSAEVDTLPNYSRWHFDFVKFWSNSEQKQQCQIKEFQFKSKFFAKSTDTKDPDKVLYLRSVVDLENEKSIIEAKKNVVRFQITPTKPILRFYPIENFNIATMKIRNRSKTHLYYRIRGTQAQYFKVKPTIGVLGTDTKSNNVTIFFTLVDVNFFKIRPTSKSKFQVQLIGTEKENDELRDLAQVWTMITDDLKFKTEHDYNEIDYELKFIDAANAEADKRITDAEESEVSQVVMQSEKSNLQPNKTQNTQLPKSKGKSTRSASLPNVSKPMAKENTKTSNAQPPPELQYGVFARPSGSTPDARK